MKIIHIVGARPNFMKMAPVWRALKKYKIKQLIVHTGQHYSTNMSDVFFKELGIKTPDVNLKVGSGTQAKQVANIMTKLEKVLTNEKPDMTLVYGDVNSTLAASLVCAKMGLKIAHVESGLRSGDLTMPEEINRMVTDRLSSLLFTPSIGAGLNLIHEGVDKKKIHFVGNVMIDTLVTYLDKIKKKSKINLRFKKFAVVTLHRPSNVDNLRQLEKIVISLNTIAKKIPLFFPIHPRTKKQLKKLKNISLNSDKIILLEPLGYTEFLNLVYHSDFILTDSGGIQEESTYLGIPCLTLRGNTERPVTVSLGTNTLVGNDFNLLNKKIDEILSKKYKKGTIPEKWDGKASARIAEIIMKQK
ncbi:MAG: UDP-N-acetylglucosamine 2-epimerase (non-hydrolyzing) [Candidatus Paceibacterota bacterium]|jgi:UDP-N-acetylglucosamine 2-epimerase (non-hydrolysing)